MRVLDIDVMKKVIDRRGEGFRPAHYDGNDYYSDERKHKSGPVKVEKQEKFIQEVVSHMKKGALTKQAKREHEKPLEFAKGVLAHPEKYTERTRKRAQFLVNIQGKKK